MSETQTLLETISALRQRLEQVRGLVNSGESVTAPVSSMGRTDNQGARTLERQLEAGREHDGLLDQTLRQLAGPEEVDRLPTQLTGRARQQLERGSDLLRRLHALADEFDLAPVYLRGRGEGPEAAPAPEDDALAGWFRETVALTDMALRLIGALPDAPSTQLRLCGGLQATLDVAARRVEGLAEALAQRRQEKTRVETLADLLASAGAGQALDAGPIYSLAEAVLEDARQGAPLRFLAGAPEQTARWVACHGLTVAQVMARVMAHDSQWQHRPLEPIVTALVHDVGMMAVPTEILTLPGPLDDAQRRVIESHARQGSELTTRLVPGGGMLAEAVADHHERLDGTGYPAGLRGSQIGSLARLLAVCDVYAALCTPRPHRPARETRTALTDTLMLVEAGKLDRYQAEGLLLLSFYPVGSVVELADGAVGVVVATPPARRDLTAPCRPVLALLTDLQGETLPFPRYVDLGWSEGRNIVRSLPAGEQRRLLGKRYPELAA
jgi:HD-GYP domain-containing protein (c-di-GMP phosphodiesterase class II)